MSYGKNKIMQMLNQFGSRAANRHVEHFTKPDDQQFGFCGDYQRPQCMQNDSYTICYTAIPYAASYPCRISKRRQL